METPIEVLRVEQSAISKELSRFRACDAETRSLYCREWAQYIYKKHFVWGAKTQEEIVPDGGPTPSITTLTAGKYQINYIASSHHHNNCDCTDEHDHNQENMIKKERSSLLGKKFEELAASWSTADADNEQSLVSQILQGCQLWMTLPSGYTGLPDTFEPVEFNPYPDAIPLVDDQKDPSQLLDPLIIERQALCLPSDCFHLLKNLTGDILLSHTTPTCHHSRPTAKTPADLEVDRAIFNEHEANAVNQALKELSLALEVTWHPLNRFLQQLEGLEQRRAQVMGKGCQKQIDAFVADQKYVSFVDFWTNEQTQFKNKKSTEEEIKKADGLFEQHLETLKACVKEFMSKFVPRILDEIYDLTNDLWKMVVPTIYELGERMAAREASKGSENAIKIDETLKSLGGDYLKKMESTKEVDLAKKRITDTLNTKVEEYMADIDALFKLYKDSARPSLSGRLEKLSNKDFKKKIKKLESGYYSIRQTFRYEVTENIFAESLFCKFALVCLEPLLQEGEMVEALTIETEVKRFLEAYKDLWKQRAALLHQFEQGVQTGRRELAGVLGKLFLKEGMRIQGDNLALKRQNSLLKSMGMEVTDEETKRKSKSKKKSSSGSSTPAQQLEPIPTLSAPVKNSPFKKTAPVTPPSEPINKKEEIAPVKKEETTAAKKTVEVAKKVTPPEVVKTASVKSLPKSPEPVKTLPKSPEPVKITSSAKPVVQKIVVEEKKSVKEKDPVEVKKPVVVASKPVAEVKKFAAPDYKKPDNRKPLASDLLPLKVKSSKIPAPAPVIEPKLEPKPVEKKKKTVAPKKKEPVAEKKEPVIEKKEPEIEKKLVEESKVIEEPVKQHVDEKIPSPEVQDWNSIRASVAEEQPLTECKVQDWNDFKVQIQLEETENKVGKEQETNSWTQPLETGWSTIAAKKPETTWSNAATAASSDTSSMKDVELGGWGSTPKKAALSPALSVASSAWSTTATVGRDSWVPSPAVSEQTPVSSTAATINGWNSSSTASEKSVKPPPGLNTTIAEKKVAPPPGLNAAAAEKPVVPPSPGWNATPVVAEQVVTSSSGWNTITDVAEKSVASPPGWNTSAPEKSVASPPGWGPLSDSEKSSTGVPASWGSEAEKPAAGPPGPNKTETKASWGPLNDTAEKSNIGWNTPAEKPKVSTAGGWLPEAVNNTDSITSLGGWGQPKPLTTWVDETAKTKTPSWNASTKKTSPEWDSAQKPWEKEDEPAAVKQEVVAPTATISSKPPGLTVPEVLAPTIPQSSFVMTPQVQVQIQNPLPGNLADMKSDMLVMMCNNLHRENGSLLQTVYSMQQEMTMMTTRYTEIMSLAREREAQNLKLFESRKQTEMEEIRRYVLSLEARMKQMEEKSDRVTAGFGNQDLFAGYREEMRTTSPPNNQHQQQGPRSNTYNRKLWKNNNVIRCGNCGETGHESTACKTNCRYCGSSEHLSESCPMN
ncbi:hypothetical protein MFLAVUS_011040 [Mucor flavus]|uniref:CCHC-type domain-containing protein n=1 Tax=Mucor flavus TaxID=439312 RepID=A0ABP9ZEE9_9FUNG